MEDWGCRKVESAEVETPGRLTLRVHTQVIKWKVLESYGVQKTMVLANALLLPSILVVASPIAITSTYKNSNPAYIFN